MFDIFNNETNTNDINYLLSSVGQNVSINNIVTKAIITNPSLNEFDDRYISTIDTIIKRGDLITYSGLNYLIINQIVAKRANKYKAIMRYCNHTIQVTEVILTPTGETNYRGEPLYATTYGEPINIACIVDSRTFSLTSDSAINLPNNQITTTVQNNPTTGDLSVNDEFYVMGKSWKILDIDRSKVGLIIFTCQAY